MTDFQAALGYLQLKKYSSNLKRRKKLAKKYINSFKDNKNINHMPFSNSCSFFTFQIFIGNAYKHKIYFANKCCWHSKKIVGIAYNLNFDYKLPRQVQYINCRQ